MQRIIVITSLFLASCTISSSQKIIKDVKENSTKISIYSKVDTGLTFKK